MVAKKAAGGAAQPETGSGAKRKAVEQPPEQAEAKLRALGKLGAGDKPAIGGGKIDPVPARPPPSATDEVLPMEAYYDNLATFVRQQLPWAMTQLGVEVQALQTTPPTTIAQCWNTKPAIGGAKLTTFREVWDVVNCAAADNFP